MHYAGGFYVTKSKPPQNRTYRVCKTGTSSGNKIEGGVGQELGITNLRTILVKVTKNDKKFKIHEFGSPSVCMI